MKHRKTKLIFTRIAGAALILLGFLGSLPFMFVVRHPQPAPSLTHRLVVVGLFASGMILLIIGQQNHPPDADAP